MRKTITVAVLLVAGFTLTASAEPVQTQPQVHLDQNVSIEDLRKLPKQTIEDPKLIIQYKRANDQRIETARLVELKRLEDIRLEEERKVQEVEAARVLAEQQRQQEQVKKYTRYGNTYTPGQCTFFVASRRYVPSNWGNANTWLGNARAQGWANGPSPQAGAIAWTGRGYYGHVAIVESVQNGMITISEMNAVLGPFNVDTRLANPGEFYYIY